MSRQKLGQHFLHSPAWRERIARTLPVDASTTWLEIGPGHGEMTEFLAQHSPRVIAIETDAALAASLRERAATEWPNVEIIESDILSVDLAELVSAPPGQLRQGMASAMPKRGPQDAPLGAEASPDPPRAHQGLGPSFVGRDFGHDKKARPHSGALAPEVSPETREPARLRQGTVFYPACPDEGREERRATVPNTAAPTAPSGAEVGRSFQASESKSNDRFRVYGNLPYYITSPILSHLFRFAAQIDSIHIVIQWEVAARIAATPGHREYAYLSALCQYFAHPEIVLRIPPGAFRPPPKVNSALVAMNLPGKRAHLGIRDDDAFLKFLQNCFSQKRKTLRNNLKNVFSDSQIAAALAACNLTPKSRAEEISLPQFAELYRALASEK